MTSVAEQRPAGFTEQQQAAVATRGVSVSLSAGAGCGKTFVLTERFLAHFDPRDPAALTPDQIGQLVAITFTDRAAREMRDRIRRRCYERLAAATQADAPYWSALLRALDSARISTIHSFCASLLRSRAVEAGLDPQFAVLEQAQAETLLSEAVDDELRRLLSERDETILELAAEYDLNGLRDMVRQFVVDGTPDEFARWLAAAPGELVEHWTEFFAALRSRIGRDLAASEPAATIVELLKHHMPTDGRMGPRAQRLLAALRRLADLSAEDSLSELIADVIESARVQSGGGAAAWSSQEVYETFRDAAKALRECAGKLTGVASFTPQAAADAARLGMQLLQLADGVRRAYERRKAELRVLDFGDLMVRTRALLVDGRHDDLARQLGAHITLLLVDEFQDTDPLQVDLVRALCGEGLKAGKLFFVGDYKQSIYRFRGADPRVFHELRGRTPAAGRLSLSRNFRSQPAILEFVNAVFRDELGDDYEPLHANRAQVSPRPAVEFLWAPVTTAAGRVSADALRGAEAEWIARRIRALVDDGEPRVWDAAASAAGGPAPRAPRYGDIAILLRALTSVETYEAALRKYDVDYYLVGGRAFYAQQEIFDLLNLLRALDSTRDVVSLVGALRSPFFSLADETIFWLAQHPLGVAGGLFAGSYSEAIPHDQRERTAFAAQTITRLRDCKDRLRICELIELALDLTGYDAVLLSEFLGERKLANLLKLKEQARAFQHGDFLGLADFIAQLTEFVSRQPDEALAATHSEDTNVVRLMSVHQAKGLEFPIVIVPDMNRPPHNQPPRVRLDARLGPLARPATPDGQPRAACGYDLWRYAEAAEDAAELSRLLYVATTRAADYLVLSSGVDTAVEAKSPWMRLLARRFDLATGRFIGQVPAGEVEPEVTVSSREPPRVKRRAKRPTRILIDELVARLETAAPRRAVQHAVEALAPDPRARTQYSFSRLSGRLHRKFERLDAHRHDDAPTPDPRGLGTLVHAVLAAVDFSAPGDVRVLVERYAEQLLPDAPGEIGEAVAMIEAFLRCERAGQIARAPASHAEIEFLLAWPPDDSPARNVTLRGYIDRLYQDAAGWHVLDFKTNRPAAGGIARQAAEYEMQMLVYGLATERIMGTPPASLVLHFLRTGEEHSFIWDDRARRRVVELVSEGIAASHAQP